MPGTKLTFTPLVEDANDRPTTMAIFVDEEQYQKYVAGDKSIPLAAMIASAGIFKFDKPGTKQGIMGKPSKTELQNAFGTTNETKILEFMLQHGHLEGEHHKAKKAVAPSHMEELLHADRRAY
mmetsp:Transcript_4/g.13  ORF Transcript_4/g.13 Transcript_4/m.13 type:complete len:123 (+) Transcript_4:52-420(+)|eukprot:scaffold34622_cov162-Amphora_coffeaeformis.AAC.5